MKLVAVSVIKNEADIVEAFVRHTQTWVDRHLIFDHDSTDGTRQILGELVAEGLALELFTGDAVGNLQQSRSNHLARVAFRECDADWVLPLDADEILVAPNRVVLESALTSGPLDVAVTLPLRNYSPTTSDDAAEVNPVRRINYRQPGPGSTRKIFIPRALGLRDDVFAGKGNHALYRGSQPLPARAADDLWLAHFALRSPYQQVARVLTAELQKLSRGRAHEGLDTHYRLGFQLLAENPERFFSTVLLPPERLTYDPAPYLGGPLTHRRDETELARMAQALVPFLEKIAVSHGQLVDRLSDVVAPGEEIIRRIELASLRPRPDAASTAFDGFTAVNGWQPEEGPVPEAFLPRFHWATGPETHLTISAPVASVAQLQAEALSYADGQVTTVFLNGAEVLRHAFGRVNQKEILAAPLALRPGNNDLVFQHRVWIESAADPRKLALIFLSLRVA